MTLNGKRNKLVPAQESDREKVYDWLAHSDLTSSIMGPPKYPDHHVPLWEEFCRDYTLAFFSDEGDGKGRNYIILANDEEVGTVGYDLLDKGVDRVVLDIWLRAERYCGKGYGSDALVTLCRFLHREYGITNFIISPSLKNKRAIAAYKKAGFEYSKTLTKKEQKELFSITEYEDNVLMTKRLIKKINAD